MDKFEGISRIENVNVLYREDELSGTINTIYVNNRIVDSGKFTIFRTHEIEYILYKNNDEEITKNVPLVSEAVLSVLDDNGVAKIGAFLNEGDIVIGKSGYNAADATPEEKLLRAIFGGKAALCHNTSIYVPKNICGTVTEVVIETRKDNKNLASNIDKVVTVVIRQDLTLQIGDVLTDANNSKGIVVGFYEPESLDTADMISNFPFDGKLIMRATSVKLNMRARGIGLYTLVDSKPLASCEFDSPQTLTKDDIIKFTKAGMFSALQDMLLCLEPTKRVECYARIATPQNQKGKHDKVISLNNRLRRFLYYIRLLGGKFVFKNSDNDKVYNNDDWSFMNLCENGFETLINQNVYLSMEPEDEPFQTYGEVTRPETIGYRTDTPEVNGLFCEKIFGTTKNWECRCGKYKNKRHQGVVCEKCGVKVESASCRDYKFGHITLASKCPNPIFSDVQNGQVLVIPPNMRPMIKYADRRYASARINDEYRRILNRNNHIKRMVEFETPEKILKNEFKMLNSSLQSLYNGVFSDIYDWIYKVLFKGTLDYSASARAIINRDLMSGDCYIPYRVALELYEPILLNLIMENKLVNNLKAAKKFINKVENKQNIIDIFNKSSCGYKLIASSPAADGEIVVLCAKIVDAFVVELNTKDWQRLKLNTSDNVKLFLPITKYSQEVLTTRIKLDDKSVNEFETFLNYFSTLKEATPKEKKQRVLQTINYVDGNKKFIDSLLFCFLSGRRTTDSERQQCIEEIAHTIDFEEEEENIPEEKLELIEYNDEDDIDLEPMSIFDDDFASKALFGIEDDDGDTSEN